MVWKYSWWILIRNSALVPATSGNAPRSQYSSNPFRINSRRLVESAPSLPIPRKSRNSRNENGNSSQDSARPRICVAISRDSSWADDPVR